MWKSAPGKLVGGLLLGILPSILLTTSMIGVVQAASASTSQGYTVEEKLPAGSLVSADGNNYQKAVSATPTNRGKLLGVVIPAEDSLISFSEGDNRQQVTSSGLALMRVSTINGEIKNGDAVSPSPISGVGMKASTEGKIIGFAQADFSSSATNQKKLDVKDNTGGSSQVKTGRLAVQIQIQDWVPTGAATSASLAALKNFVSSAAGKPVSNAQALIAAGVILLAIIISAIILYSAVSASIHSIGRNPLSRSVVKRSLFMMVGLAIVVVFGACSGVYLLLRG